MMALLLLCGSLLPAPEALGATHMDAAGLFELMEQRAAQTQTIRFTLSQTASMSGQTIRGEWEGTCKSPGKFRLSIRMSTPVGTMATLLVSDGETVWQEVKTTAGIEVIRYDLTSAQASAALPFSRLGLWGMVGAQGFAAFKERVTDQYHVRVSGVDEVSGTPVYVVDLEPRAGAQGSERMRLRVGMEDGFTRAVETYDAEGNALMSLVLRGLQFNEPVADSLFEYAPPSGVQVRDGSAGP
jgi:outer membrane lipoprotein-sorting protein